MAIRQKAFNCPAFCGLLEVYNNRKAALTELKGSRKKIVFTVGCDVPEEIIIAAGMVPFPVTGYYGGERHAAEKYLEYSFGAVWKGIFETIAEDYQGLMEHAVFCSSSDMILKLFYYFRTLKMTEPERPLPEMIYLDFELVHKVFRTQERNERELRDLVQAVERWSGNSVTKAALSGAVRLCNEYRRALREFCALRGKENCRVSGSEALVVIGGSMFMEKAAAIEAVRQVTEAAAEWDIIDAVRVYYTGSVQETRELYEIAEANGCNIVGEDHYMGERLFDTDVDSSIDPVKALAARLIGRMPSSEKGSIRDRVRWLEKEIREKDIEGFLTFMNTNDEAYVWDLPSLKTQVLEPAGVPELTVQKQKWPLEDRESLAAQLAGLARAVREGK